MNAGIGRAVFALLMVLGSHAHAQEYPAKPVTVVVPFTAGGPTDVVARVVAAAAGVRLGQPMVIENRPGAGSMIGATAVANAQPDGYTLLLSTTTTYATNPHVFKKVTYDARKLEPIAMVAKVPLGLAVRPDMPVNSIQELEAFAARQANALQQGSAGPGAHGSMSCFRAARAAGVRLEEIPYPGLGPALADVMAGKIDAMCDAVGTLTPHYSAGKVKVLAILDSERSPSMKDVPTFSELGYEDVVINSWMALAGPAGTPAEVVEKVARAVEESLRDESVEAKLSSIGFVPNYMAPEDAAAFMSEEYDIWEGVVKELGISIE